MIYQPINFPFSSSILSTIVGRESILLVHTPTLAELSGSGAASAGTSKNKRRTAITTFRILRSFLRDIRHCLAGEVSQPLDTDGNRTPVMEVDQC